jgi:hypothetical protein
MFTCNSLALRRLTPRRRKSIMSIPKPFNHVSDVVDGITHDPFNVIIYFIVLCMQVLSRVQCSDDESDVQQQSQQQQHNGDTDDDHNIQQQQQAHDDHRDNGLLDYDDLHDDDDDDNLDPKMPRNKDDILNPQMPRCDFLASPHLHTKQHISLLDDVNHNGDDDIDDDSSSDDNDDDDHELFSQEQSQTMIETEAHQPLVTTLSLSPPFQDSYNRSTQELVLSVCYQNVQRSLPPPSSSSTTSAPTPLSPVGPIELLKITPRFYDFDVDDIKHYPNPKACKFFLSLFKNLFRL